MKTKFSSKENTGSGLALIFILLFIGLKWDYYITFKIDFVLILLLMISPVAFYPFSIIWLNLADFLGKYMSKLILAVIFYLFVMPVGLIRKLSKKDKLKIKQFHKSNESVFIDRNHVFTGEDMKYPY